MFTSKPTQKQPFQQSEDNAFSSVESIQQYPLKPIKTPGLLESIIQRQHLIEDKHPAQIVLLENSSCLVVHNGLVFKQKDENELQLFDELNQFGYVHFVLQSDLMGSSVIMAVNDWDIVEINLETQRRRVIIIKNIYENAQYGLNNYLPVAWTLSNSKRILNILCRGSKNDQLFFIDLAYQTVIKKQLPSSGFQKIVWSYDDRYLGLFNKYETLVMETSFYDYQLIKLQEPIKNISFESDKLAILTLNLELLVYRRADSVFRKQENIFQKFLFPQRIQQQSKVQFYLHHRTRETTTQVSDRCQTAFIKIKDQIKRILLFDQGILLEAQINPIEDTQLTFKLIDESYWNHLRFKIKNNMFFIRELEEGTDKQIQQMAQDFQVQVVQEINQGNNVVQAKAYRLHIVDEFNLLLNQKVIHI